jgi:hypothetical protein
VQPGQNGHHRGVGEVAGRAAGKPPEPSKLLQKPWWFNNFGSPFSDRISGVSTPLEPDAVDLLVGTPVFGSMNRHSLFRYRASAAAAAARLPRQYSCR